MTKWKRLRKLREKKRFDAEVLRPKAEREEAKQTEPEKISKNIQQSQEIEKLESAKTSNTATILAQIPRYVYLLAIFALLAGVFFPLITPGVPFDHVIQGTATLFLGLVGAILLFKATTSDNRRGILIAIGFALITISLALIYHLQEAFRSMFF
jgi:ABC-type transport system involved in cytochrome c biogenesis permease subunit